MKRTKSHVFALSSFGFISLLMSSLAVLTSNIKEDKSVSAYSSSDLPTTIYLRDNTEEEIRNYYSSLNSLATSERQGTNLLKNLKKILKNGQKYYSYDYNYGKQIWQMYEITDRDWEKSPASSTTYGQYDSINNRLVNYQYGTSNSNKKNDPYVHALYVNRDVDNQAKVWGDHTTEGWGINREHVWAKSHGMGSDDDGEDSAGARGDPMHLMAANGYVNGSDWKYHSNYFFAFVDKNQTYYDPATDGSGYTYLTGNNYGKSLNRGWSRTVFEPQDSDKGDIARAIFYMAARYNFLSGEDEDGINVNNPNLVIYDSEYDSYSNSSYVASESNPGQMGVLRDLLAWNRLDPPDEYEIHRNNLLFNNYTNNRNPFIDFPEWAEYIWGKPTIQSDNRTISSFNTTPTGYATPSTDAINELSTIVPVTGVSVSPTSKTLEVGEAFQLEYTIEPSNATNKNVYYHSDNTSVATISDTGYVTAVGEGNAYVSVWTEDGNFAGYCSVTVTSSSIVSDYTLTLGSPYINGVPYKMYFDHTKGDGSRYYFTGSIVNTYYGSSSKEYSDAVDVYFEPNGAGQNIYFMNGTIKTYIYVIKSGSYSNFGLMAATPDSIWVYREVSGIYSCMTYETNGSICTLGTRNTYTTFSGIFLNNTSIYNNIDFISSDKDSDTSISATGMATVFKDNVFCDSTGNNAPNYRSGVTWSTFESLYAKLSSDTKTLLATTPSDEGGSALEAGLAKYDYILGKYNTSSTDPYNDFLGRIENNLITLDSLNNFDSSNNAKTILIIISATFLLTTLFITLVIKRKKHR